MAGEDFIYTTLAADSSVTSLIGQFDSASPQAPAIFPVIAPQDAPRPFIVYSLVSSQPTNIFDAAPTLDNRRVQVDCYAEAWETAKQIANAVRASLEDVCHLVSENPDDYEADTKLFRKSHDYSLWIDR